ALAVTERDVRAQQQDAVVESAVVLVVALDDRRTRLRTGGHGGGERQDEGREQHGGGRAPAKHGATIRATAPADQARPTAGAWSARRCGPRRLGERSGRMPRLRVLAALAALVAGGGTWALAGPEGSAALADANPAERKVSVRLGERVEFAAPRGTDAP